MRAIRAAHAFDGLEFLPGGATVVLDGDRIVDVLVGDRTADLPSDLPLTSYAGTVLPGLFDCHTHLVADATFGGLERTATMSPDAIDEVILESLRRHAVAGVTTVRDLGDRDYRTLAFRNRPGLPRLVAAGPPITTSGGHCHFLGGVADDGVRAAVAEHVERGVDVVKVMASGGFATPGSDQFGGQFTVPELLELVAAAHSAGLPVVAHAHSLVGVQNAVAAGVDGIEHFTCLALGGQLVSDELLAEIARRRIFIDMTFGDDRALYPDPAELPPHLAAVFAQVGVKTIDEFFMGRLEILQRLRCHQASVVTGVDSGMMPPKQHGNAWRAVAIMVEAGGYSAAEALRAATSLAADACRLAGETGRLATGQAADILVVDGDLSTDLAALGRPQEVVIRGVRVLP